MKFSSYIADRIGYILLFVFHTVLVVLVVELNLLGQKATLGKEDVLYIALLAVVGLFVYFVADYLRNRPFHRQLDRLLASQRPDIDGALRLDGASTREQRAMRAFAEAQYGAYTEQLEQYRQQQERHLTFVHQWVHQMKTPVSVIGLLVQQAEETGSPEAKAFAASVREEAERLEHGLDMMLHTARLEKPELDMHIRRTELLGAIRDAINEHKKACIRYRIYPKIEADAEAVWAETDEKWLRFVLTQLISNAIKYTKSKVGSKTLTVTVAEEQGGYCRITVKDEGIGIAEHDLPRIFQAFFTGENGRQTGESTGMGLYLAKQVCDRLGHRLEVRSVLGGGTEATLRLARQAGIYGIMQERGQPPSHSGSNPLS